MNAIMIDATRITSETNGAVSGRGLHRRSTTMRRQLTTKEIQFVAGVLLVGMSQVVGIRLGVTTLALIDKSFAWRCTRSRQEKQDSSEFDASNQDAVCV